MSRFSSLYLIAVLHFLSSVYASQDVREGEKITAGVQRIFAAFKKTDSPTFRWQISPAAQVGVAVLDTGADFWHPDFCNNCPLGSPLPPRMDSNLHEGFAAIPTTDTSPLNPDPPPMQDDNGHGTATSG